MQKIIGEGNKVNYGVFDEKIDFNYRDYRLWNFFGKEIKGLRKKIAMHAFNYVGINAGEVFVGLACVRLGYGHMVFAYVYDYDKGMVFDYNKLGPGRGGLDFPGNPDEYVIKYEKGKNLALIRKSHDKQNLYVEADLGGRLEIKISAPYGLEDYSPLRVLNPSEPYRWTFTEKCSPIKPEAIRIILDGKDLEIDPENAAILYDWSGGYLRRETNWYWAAFASPLPQDESIQIGANFAALTNEAFFSENAFWIGKERTRISRCIFDFDMSDLYKPWHIWDEDGQVDLHFTPKADRGEKVNALLIKSNFNQFFGFFSGKLAPKGKEAVEFEKIHGLTEFHRALW